MSWKSMSRTALALCSTALVAACEPPAPAPECQSPSIKPQDVPTGTGGTNGLDSPTFHLLSSELLETTSVALTTMKTPPVKGKVYPLRQDVKELFLKPAVDDPENGKQIRQAIFEHAMQCALPDGVKVDDGERTYEGRGLLTSTAGWFNGPLDTPAAEDLFVCLAVLLNPYFEGVPIYLSGNSVHISEQEPPPHVEAVWTVDLRYGRPRYHVWPILDVVKETTCWSEDTAAGDPWRFRVCGQDLYDCGVDVRVGLFDEECQKEEKDPIIENHFLCTAKAAPDEPPAVAKHAIQTRLFNLCDANYLFCPTPQ